MQDRIYGEMLSKVESSYKKKQYILMYRTKLAVKILV